MTARNRKTPTAAKYVPTKRELAAIGRIRTEREKGGPRLKVSKNGDRTAITPDHPQETIGVLMLMEAVGTTDPEFYDGFLTQLAIAGTQGSEIDQQGLNFMLAVVKGIQPRDQVEAMLAAQMAAVHRATMTFARRLANIESIPQQDSAERAFNKLTRTFAAQMEALKRYRTGGEQKVTVQHVSVSEGGQAIVGNVTHGAAVPDNAAGSRPALTDAKAVPMPHMDARKRRTQVPAAHPSKK